MYREREREIHAYIHIYIYTYIHTYLHRPHRQTPPVIICHKFELDL